MYEQKTPSHYVTEYNDPYDCTGHIGPLNESEWGMYSFNMPSFDLWNAMAAELNAKGWNDEEIKDFLQSKQTRWMLDGKLGEELRKLGKKYAKNAIKIAEWEYLK
jgi:hypothetical protein